MTTTEKKASIHESLAVIQSKLSVPKTHENKFGGYKFRNTSDILDAVKPLAKENGCDVTINDELVMLGNRFYIKATASLTNSYRDWETDRKSTRLNSSHRSLSRMPSSA